jgi:molybdenum cofactor synthesis domain-containing protein
MVSQRGPYRAITDFREIGEVLEEIRARVRPLVRTVSMRTRDAVGMVVARGVMAPRDHPPLHMSHMDGFAVRSTDIRDASEERPVFLRVVGSIGPGQTSEFLEKGCAVRIHTGGYLPEGADAVIRQEEIAIADSEKIGVTRPIEPMENVVPAGSEVREGEVLVRSGEILGPAMASLLETLGIAIVEVRAPVRVAIVSFGDELTEDPEEVQRGKLLNSHAYLVYHMVKRLFCDPMKPIIVPDDPGQIREATTRLLSSSDCVLTIGGSSVGDIDLVSAELKRLAELFMQGIKLQPGRVGGAAVIDGKPLIMLPGLIHSTVNVFNYLAAPILAHLGGTNIEQFMLRVRAYLDSEIHFPKRRNFVRVVWVTLSRRGDAYYARPNISDASSIRSIAESHGYVEVPPMVVDLKAGQPVEVKIPLWLAGYGLNIFGKAL